jgi:hypothetical protein
MKYNCLGSVRQLENKIRTHMQLIHRTKLQSMAMYCNSPIQPFGQSPHWLKRHACIASCQPSADGSQRAGRRPISAVEPSSDGAVGDAAMRRDHSDRPHSAHRLADGSGQGREDSLALACRRRIDAHAAPGSRAGGGGGGLSGRPRPASSGGLSTGGEIVTSHDKLALSSSALIAS